MDGALDRKILKGGTVRNSPISPTSPIRSRVALDVLSRKPEGFLLMVEFGPDR